MRMENPIPTFKYLVEQLAERYPNLAYLHAIEDRDVNSDSIAEDKGDSLDFLARIWAPRTMILAGGFKPDSAANRVQRAHKNGENIFIAFGRWFLSNPDLPHRIKNHIPLSKYDRTTFYGNLGALGYTDYPTAEQMFKEEL